MYNFNVCNFNMLMCAINFFINEIIETMLTVFIEKIIRLMKLIQVFVDKFISEY